MRRVEDAEAAAEEAVQDRMVQSAVVRIMIVSCRLPSWLFSAAAQRLYNMEVPERVL
jgi:hypothetical protein